MAILFAIFSFENSVFVNANQEKVKNMILYSGPAFGTIGILITAILLNETFNEEHSIRSAIKGQVKEKNKSKINKPDNTKSKDLNIPNKILNLNNGNIKTNHNEGWIDVGNNYFSAAMKFADEDPEKYEYFAEYARCLLNTQENMSIYISDACSNFEKAAEIRDKLKTLRNLSD